MTTPRITTGKPLAALFFAATCLAAPAGAETGFWQQQPDAPADQTAQTAPVDAPAFAGEWVVSVEPTGGGQEGATPFADALLFRGGHLTAAAVAMYGFAPAAYTVDSAGGVEAFEAEMTSDAHGTMVWTGRRGGNGLIGELTWTKEDGRTCRYTFAADRPAGEQIASADSPDGL